MDINRLKGFLEKSDTMYLATCIDNKPHVRCMAMIYFENTIWCCSKSNRLKIEEIKQNGIIETCIMIEGENDFGSIRGSGNAILIKQKDIRSKLSKQIPFFKAYWDSPEDKDFTLIKLEITSFVLHDPDDKQFYTISNSNES